MLLKKRALPRCLSPFPVCSPSGSPSQGSLGGLGGDSGAASAAVFLINTWGRRRWLHFWQWHLFVHWKISPKKSPLRKSATPFLGCGRPCHGIGCGCGSSLPPLPLRAWVTQSAMSAKCTPLRRVLDTFPDETSVFPRYTSGVPSDQGDHVDNSSYSSIREVIFLSVKHL